VVDALRQAVKQSNSSGNRIAVVIEYESHGAAQPRPKESHRGDPEVPSLGTSRKAGPCVSEVEPIPLRDAPGKTRRIQTAKDFLALPERYRTLVRAALLLAQAISLSNGVCDTFVDAGPDVAVA